MAFHAIPPGRRPANPSAHVAIADGRRTGLRWPSSYAGVAELDDGHISDIVDALIAELDRREGDIDVELNGDERDTDSGDAEAGTWLEDRIDQTSPPFGGVPCYSIQPLGCFDDAEDDGDAEPSAWIERIDQSEPGLAWRGLDAQGPGSPEDCEGDEQIAAPARVKLSGMGL